MVLSSGNSGFSQEEWLIYQYVIIYYVLLFEYSLGSNLALDRWALDVIETGVSHRVLDLSSVYWLLKSF
jgi:hypothetical protein